MPKLTMQLREQVRATQRQRRPREAPRGGSLAALQRVHDGSPRVQALASMSAVLQRGPGHVVQRKPSASTAGGVVQRVLDWEDLQWVAQSKPAFRFHTNGNQLKQEVAGKKLSGHKHPLFYMQDIFASLGLEGITSLDQVPEERRVDVTREYERRLVAMAQSSLAHVEESTFTPAGFVLAELEESEFEQQLNAIMGRKEDANLITGLRDTPFGAYLGDISQEQLKDDRYVLSGFDTVIDSKPKFDQEKLRLASLVAEYIKLRGKRPKGELTLGGEHELGGAPELGGPPALEEAMELGAPDPLSDYEWTTRILDALSAGKYDYLVGLEALQESDARLAALEIPSARVPGLINWLELKIQETEELL